MTEEQPKTIRDEIEGLSKAIAELSGEEQKKKKKKRPMRIPFAAKLTRRDMKENYANVLYIRENHNVEFMKLPISEGAVLINDKPYVASTDYVLHYKNKPFLIIPEWGTHPFSKASNLNQAERDQRTNLGYKILLNKMKTESIEPKKRLKVSGWLILTLIILGIIAYYFFNQGGV